MSSLGNHLATDALARVSKTLRRPDLVFEYCACRRHQCCQIKEAETSACRRFMGSSQASNALDRASTLRFVGVIVDQNVRCRTAKTRVLTNRCDVAFWPISTLAATHRYFRSWNTSGHCAVVQLMRSRPSRSPQVQSVLLQ